MTELSPIRQFVNSFNRSPSSYLNFQSIGMLEISGSQPVDPWIFLLCHQTFLILIEIPIQFLKLGLDRKIGSVRSDRMALLSTSGWLKSQFKTNYKQKLH